MSNRNTLSSTLPVARNQTLDQRNGEAMLKMIERQTSAVPAISLHAPPEQLATKPVISTATHGAPQSGAYFDRNLDEFAHRGRGRGRGRGQYRGRSRNRGRGTRGGYVKQSNYNLPNQLFNFGKPGGPMQA